ncbi:MAG: hypothetical protein ACRERU_13640, partial [Methylococcales bacterium]
EATIVNPAFKKSSQIFHYFFILAKTYLDNTLCYHVKLRVFVPVVSIIAVSTALIQGSYF